MSIKEFNSGIQKTPSKSSVLYAFYLLTGANARSIQRHSEEMTAAWTIWTPL